MTVTFFGHKDTPAKVESDLREVIKELIEKYGADKFYIGNQGNFDSMVLRVLRELKKDYPHIIFYVVLAYIPTQNTFSDDFETIIPDGIENTPPKFAISKRNRWMVENSEAVITYVTVSFGGASQFKTLAEKKNKLVINIAK